MGRVPGCLCLGALFFVWVGRDEWREGGTNGGTNGQSASGAAAWSCLVRSFRRQSVRSVFGGVRCGGLPGGGEPSALRWMAAGAEFPCGVPGGEGHRRCGGCSGMRFWRFLSKGFC